MPCCRSVNQRPTFCIKSVIYIDFYKWRNQNGNLFNVCSTPESHTKYILHGERWSYHVSSREDVSVVQDEPSDYDFLHIEWAKEKSTYVLISSNALWNPVLHKVPWINSSDTIKGSYKLKCGGCIQIGIAELNIKACILPNVANPNIEIMKVLSSIFPKRKFELSIRSYSNLSTEAACKICFLGSEDGPLIFPCLCKFTCIHIGCLRTWISSRHLRASGRVMQWTPFKCEVCSHIYLPYVDLDTGTPTSQFIEGKTVSIIEPPSLLPPLLILYNKVTNMAYIISFTDKDSVITIGRDADRDICIDNISVSRLHAQLQWNGNDFYIQDCNSKFGTFTLDDIVTKESTIWPNMNYHKIGSRIIGIRIVAKHHSNFWTSLPGNRLKNDIVRIERLNMSSPAPNNKWYEGMSYSNPNSEASNDDAITHNQEDYIYINEHNEDSDGPETVSISMDDPFK